MDNYIYKTIQNCGNSLSHKSESPESPESPAWDSVPQCPDWLPPTSYPHDLAPPLARSQRTFPDM